MNSPTRRAVVGGLGALTTLAACGRKAPPADLSGAPPEVRFRPVPQPQSAEGLWLTPRVARATWDAGLAEVCALLCASATQRDARLAPSPVASAQAIAGYPGHARFARLVNDGSPPLELLDAIAGAAERHRSPVDVGLARRQYADGATLWVAGMAHRVAWLDALPRDLALDELVPVHIEPEDRAATDAFSRLLDPLLFLAGPEGEVRSIPLQAGVDRWLDEFHVPGRYLAEVVLRGEGTTRVALWWALHVDVDPEPVASLPGWSVAPPDPMTATDALYDACHTLRAESGLAPLRRFEPFERLAREHAALLASLGRVEHVVPGVADGVAARADGTFYPRAHHWQNLAVADDWREALDGVRLSPGHLRNLLVPEATHLSVGVALEPVTQRRPRLFAVWQVLAFPLGEPRPLPVGGVLP